MGHPIPPTTDIVTPKGWWTFKIGPTTSRPAASSLPSFRPTFSVHSMTLTYRQDKKKHDL